MQSAFGATLIIMGAHIKLKMRACKYHLGVLRQSLWVLKKSHQLKFPLRVPVIDGNLKTSGFLALLLRCGNTINLIWKRCGTKITAAWRIRQISWWMNERNSQNERGKHVWDAITQFLLLCGEMETAVMCNMLMRNASIFQRQTPKNAKRRLPFFSLGTRPSIYQMERNFKK